MVISYRHNIFAWGIAEKPFILSGEMADIFISNGYGCAGNIQVVRKHQTLCFMQAHSFLKLNGAYARYLLKSTVESRRSHANSFSQFFHQDMEHFLPLSQPEYAAIEKVRRILAGIPKVPCTDCRYCEKGCPQHVSISGIFKNYNDYLLHHDIELLRGDYEWQVRNGDRASACIGCGACESVCPQSIPIIMELKKASAIFDR
jgi:predicted aldo/keto reductase-like oxidoreductase